MSIQKINPKQYIADYDPVPVHKIRASQWYETLTETVTVFLEQENATDAQHLVWLLTQGWTLTGSQYETAGSEVGGNRINYYLEKRQLNSDLALDEMISQTTTSYNEGRLLNDERYDNILNVFAVLLDYTENSLNNLGDDEDDSSDKILEFINLLPDDFDNHAADPDIDLDAYGTAQRARINLQWDNVVSERSSSMIDRGIYNTLTWDSVYTGIEGERTIALNSFEDDLMRLKADLAHRLYEQKVSMRQGVINGYLKWKDNKNGTLGRLELQSKITLSMLAFMERREDGYPDINHISQMAAQFGSANSTEVQP